MILTSHTKNGYMLSLQGDTCLALLHACISPTGFMYYLASCRVAENACAKSLLKIYLQRGHVAE